MGKLEAVSRVAGYMLSLAIILFLVLSLAGKIKIAVVEGISMEPTFHTGDMVLLRKKPASEIKVGDVVVYKSGSRLIIHRVVKVFEYNGETCYVIKGDNNPVPDRGFPECGGKGVPYDRIIGVVAEVGSRPAKLPYLGGIAVLIYG